MSRKHRCVTRSVSCRRIRCCSTIRSSTTSPTDGPVPAGKTSLSEEEKGPFLRLPRHQVERLGKGRVTAERSTTLGGAPATEFEFSVANVSGVYRYGFVQAGNRLLFVMAKAAGPMIGRADAQSFLDSIRPTE